MTLSFWFHPEGIVVLYFIFFLLGYVVSSVFLPRIMKMIAAADFVRPNYCGNPIPVGVGMVFFMTVLAILAVSYVFLPLYLQSSGVVFALGLSVLTMLGLVDDVWGSREASGLKGHFVSLIKKGQLTTGALKAIAGGVTALLLSAMMGGWQMIPLNALIIALSVNAINLLDLRPGRAGKSFLLFAFLFMLAGWLKPELVYLFAAVGSLVAYLPVDLKARSMMGDTGSNALGAALGITAVWVLDFPLKLAYLVFLVFLHLFAEKYSLTKVIAGNKVLNYLDKMGRDNN